MPCCIICKWVIGSICYNIFLPLGMSSNKKTIKINLDDFGLKPKRKSQPRNKTIKSMPVVKPNALKKKLIERIKQHRSKDSSSNGNGAQIRDVPPNVSMPLKTYVDEFNDSLKYLSNLANEQDKVSPYPTPKSKKKTIKRAENNNHPYVHVELDLPDELKSIQQVTPSVQTDTSITLTPPTKIHQHPPPYGCLKNGSKPTYRTWNKTIRNPTSMASTQEIDNPIVIDTHDSTTPIQPALVQPSDREVRLQMLKDKFKDRSLQSKMSPHPTIVDENIQHIASPIAEHIVETFANEEPDMTYPSVSPSIHIEDPISTIVKTPLRTKKTTTRKYKLGKQADKRRVGVLIKDKHTRKKVLDAQRAIRRKNMVDVKSYLHDHGLIKVGSSAPPDVVRKIYESSMMTGEINNQDSDLLAYNLMKNEETM